MLNRVLLLILITFGFGAVNAQPTRLLCYNIRYNSPNDGKNCWDNRKEQVAALLKFHSPGIFGLQEAEVEQVEYLQEQLADYAFVGVGRDDGKMLGEFCPVFYDVQRYQLLERSWFWLSETPAEPSRGWDALCNRICTCCLFTDNVSKKKFWVFNTHLDHRGTEARAKSIELIVSKIETLNTDGYPLFLMGDFNLTPETALISALGKVLADSRNLSLTKPYGPLGTSNGFNFLSDLTKRIDYIFIQGDVKVNKYGVLSDSFNSCYPSDHLPVLIEADI